MTSAFLRFGTVLSFIMLTMARSLPLMNVQLKNCIYASKSYVDKIRIKFRVLSILITLSLENSVETADSMRARGYGLKGRSSYSVFKWTVSDTVFLTAALFAAGIVLALVAAGFSGFYYYPVMSVPGFRVADVILYSALAVLTFAAAILEIKENILWRYLRSKI